jgi:predicted RNA polymerase sigma factor
MNISPDKVQQEVDLLYKSHYGKMVALLFNSYPDISLETVEDLVQDSFTAALTAWAKGGVPSNPAGRTRPIADHDQLYAPAADIPESVFDDQQLRLLFACAHPDLPPKTQVVITLKYVINLKVEAIAAALGMTVDGISKLLLRARQKIRDEKILLAEPAPSLLKSRLPIVHKIIYLIFNEGYKTSSGKKLLKEELCEEALLINKSLLDDRIGDKTTAALHALMLLNAARFKTRFGTLGELLDLEEQDRSLWNRGLVLLAGDFMTQSKGPELSTQRPPGENSSDGRRSFKGKGILCQGPGTNRFGDRKRIYPKNDR